MLHAQTPNAMILAPRATRAARATVARISGVLFALLTVLHRMSLIVAAVATGRLLAVTSGDMLPWVLRDMAICYGAAILVTAVLLLAVRPVRR
jgi:hypothetical protein